MITVTVREMIGAQQALHELSAARIKGKTLYDAGKLKKLVVDELDLYNKTRREICVRHNGKLNGNNMFDFATPADNVAANDELELVWNNEVQLGVSKLSYEALEAAGVPVEVISGLFWAIEEPKSDQPPTP